MNAFEAVPVFNRRNVPYETMFDGITISFKPHQTRFLQGNVARSIVEQSILKIDLASGVPNVYALGIPDDPYYDSTPLDGSLANKNDVEVLDRSNVQKLTETEPKALTQDGAESLGIGTVEKTLPPLPGTDPAEGGGASVQVVQPAAADEVKSVSFQNRPQSAPRGPAQHRVTHKNPS